jgi:hypothetical protein
MALLWADTLGAFKPPSDVTTDRIDGDLPRTAVEIARGQKLVASSVAALEHFPGAFRLHDKRS